MGDKDKTERTSRKKSDGHKDKTERTPRNIDKKDTLLKNVFRSFKHKIWSVEQTDFHGDFIRMYEESKELGKVTKCIIERVKITVQPNPVWQRDILPPGDDFTTLDLFSSCLSESGKTLTTQSPNVAGFYEKMSAALNECGKAHGLFLATVKTQTLEPLNKYLNEDLEKIRSEYYTLQRYKKIYDDGHYKLKHCKPDKIEKAATDLNDIKSDFERKANEVTNLLNRLPEHKDGQRNAVRKMSEAYSTYHTNCFQIMTRVLRVTSDSPSSNKPITASGSPSAKTN